ncbi:MAG: response regulator [Anaerolineales bacterium]|nr:response regulator [Anaerolineales bacterium]
MLLVEDNPIDVELTRRALARRRLLHPLEVARDGEEALARIRSWEAGAPAPLIILLDLKLPKVNGLEVLQHLKAHVHYRVIPVIVLTTSAEVRDVESAYQLGVNSYIVKPVDFDRFVEVAETLEHYWTAVNIPPPL